MSERETWFIPLTPIGKSYPDALTTRISYKVEFPTNLCCACGEPQPAVLEEIEFREESALSSLPLLFPYKNETQLIARMAICRGCAERIKGKHKWSVPWKELGTMDERRAKRKLAKLIQVNILPKHPEWLQVTLTNKECSDAFRTANPNARRKL